MYNIYIFTCNLLNNFLARFEGILRHFMCIGIYVCMHTTRI